MKQIHLEPFWTGKTFKDDVSFLAKIKNIQLKIINLESDSRLEQKKVI